MVLVTDSLTRRALDRFLERLGPDRDTAAREYEAIRRKLIEFFERRGAPLSEPLVDETLNRVARKIEEGEAVEHVRAYCYGVGRRVFLEWQKRRAREVTVLEQRPAMWAAPDPPHLVEARVSCLEGCLEELPLASRELIVGYYEGEGKGHLPGRKALADALDLTYATLKTRAYRIRLQLEECLQRCLEKIGDL